MTLENEVPDWEKDRLERLKRLSYKHYQEWLEFENEESSPVTWLNGSFATVRGLMRIPHDAGRPEITKLLLALLKKDIADFEESLKT